jgi:hypothetical protein
MSDSESLTFLPTPKPYNEILYWETKYEYSISFTQWYICKDIYSTIFTVITQWSVTCSRSVVFSGYYGFIHQ